MVLDPYATAIVSRRKFGEMGAVSMSSLECALVQHPQRVRQSFRCLVSGFRMLFVSSLQSALLGHSHAFAFECGLLED